MERGMTADQVLKALWRRKVLVGAIAASVFAVGAAISLAMPSVYEATAVVRVEAQRPAAEMVQPTVSELIEQRLLTVRQELLARPVLQRAIEEMNLYPEVVSEEGMEAAVAALRKDITVRVEGETAFEIAVQARDAETAAKVANRLPAIWSEQTARLRAEQAQRATTLFNEEVEALKKSLAGWEKRIADFKVSHMGELPEQLEMNMRGMETVGHLLRVKSEELRVAEARRSDLARGQLAGDSEAGRLKAAEDGLKQELVAAQSQWTKDHPEVQRLGREYSSMRARRQEAESRMVAERLERTRAAQLVKDIQEEIVGLQKQAETYQQRLDRTPQWAHELGVLQRDYEITRTKYQSVVSRKVEAEIAQEMEAKSAKGMFNVVSPAGVPISPASPDRLSGLLLSLLVALGVALLVAVVLEMRDDSIRDQTEIREQLPVPVLAVVPQLGEKAEKRVLMPHYGRNAMKGGGEQPLN